MDYLKLFKRAVNRRDGPLLVKVMDAINTLLRFLKYPPIPADPFEAGSANALRTAVQSWKAIPKDVVMRVIEETYQRVVGPRMRDLKKYSAFSNEVYGELMPSFVSEMVRRTGLREDALFLDLGSGVGNVVLQASLQTGCRSYGIELNRGPAEIARGQLEQLQMRCRMWGVRMGEVELEEGDMERSERLDRLVKEADVVLVNNKVFAEARESGFMMLHNRFVADYSRK